MGFEASGTLSREGMVRRDMTGSFAAQGSLRVEKQVGSFTYRDNHVIMGYNISINGTKWIALNA
jgi:hypothetical protein